MRGSATRQHGQLVHSCLGPVSAYCGPAPLCIKYVNTDETMFLPSGACFLGAQTDFREVGEWVFWQPCKGQPFSMIEHRVGGFGVREQDPQRERERER